MTYQVDRRAMDHARMCNRMLGFVIVFGAMISITVEGGLDDGLGLVAPGAAEGSPLAWKATLHSSVGRCAALRLRGGEGALQEVQGLGAEHGPPGSGETDGRAAETRQELLAFTRSPSPIPANPAPEFPFSKSPSRSPSVDPSVYTRSSSPNGLLIAMCAWESMHTIAVGMFLTVTTSLSHACTLRAHMGTRADGLRETLPD